MYGNKRYNLTNTIVRKMLHSYTISNHFMAIEITIYHESTFFSLIFLVDRNWCFLDDFLRIIHMIWDPLRYFTSSYRVDQHLQSVWHIIVPFFLFARVYCKKLFFFQCQFGSLAPSWSRHPFIVPSQILLRNALYTTPNRPIAKLSYIHVVKDVHQG